jgi:phosphate transport system permease protein
MKIKLIEEKIFLIISAMATLITILILILILGKITFEAIPSLNLYFLLTPESDAPGYLGGIANAIVGTLIISFFSVFIATPLAICTSIYLTKYAKDTIFTKILKFTIEVLSGTPSIVLGIFGLLVLVFYLKHYTGGFSLLTGSLALAILILPVIEKATEEAINTVPLDIENASYALGATKWDTIKNIVIPYSLSGIVTGIILGIGRAAEESAVVVLTAGYTQFIPSIGILSNPKLVFGIQINPIQDLVGVLPITIFHVYEYSHKVSLSDGFAAAFVLIIIVMIINAIARLILWRWKIG